jgi:predicted nucleic acid-binding protein
MIPVPAAAVKSSRNAVGREMLYSEDMYHGQDYSGVRVVNPFK